SLLATSSSSRFVHFSKPARFAMPRPLASSVEILRRSSSLSSSVLLFFSNTSARRAASRFLSGNCTACAVGIADSRASANTRATGRTRADCLGMIDQLQRRRIRVGSLFYLVAGADQEAGGFWIVDLGFWRGGSEAVRNGLFSCGKKGRVVW